MPKVSVIIPVYNGADYVAGAIESVLAQTYQDFEIIAVDDGSTDKTFEVVKGFTDSRLTYIHQANRGVSNARNMGLTRARGKYIAFLDADDYWQPTKLERQLAAFRTRPELGLVYSQLYSLDASGQCLYKRGASLKPGDDRAETYFRLLLGNFIPTPSVVVVRRECCQGIGGFDETMRHAEDWDYWLRIAEHYPIGVVAEPLACRRVARGESLLRKMSARGAQEARLKIVTKAQKRGGVPESTLHLAFALAWFRGALIDLGLGQEEEGQRRLQKALEYETCLFSDHEDVVLQHVIQLATQFCTGQQEAKLGEHFIHSVWTALPNTAFSRKQLRKALSLFHAGQFFQGHGRGDRGSVYTALWPMIANGPQRLLNRGVWSVALRALMGRLDDLSVEGLENQRPG